MTSAEKSVEVTTLNTISLLILDPTSEQPLSIAQGSAQGGVLGSLQKSHVDLRQQKFARIRGVCSEPSGFFTVTRKASCLIAPPRGSGMTGHITQGKPSDPSVFRVTIWTIPFAARLSIWSAVVSIGVPSKSLPLIAAIGSSTFLPSSVNAFGV